MIFLLELLLAVTGVVLAAALVRAAFAGGRSPSWGRSVAVAAVAVVVVAGLGDAGGALDHMKSRRAKWAPVPTEQVLVAQSAEYGIDPAFLDFAKGHLGRGDTFWVSRNADGNVRSWLNYRLAPNLAEDSMREADWLVYWREEDPFATHGVRVEDIFEHQKWGPDVGLIRLRREG